MGKPSYNASATAECSPGFRLHAFAFCPQQQQGEAIVETASASLPATPQASSGMSSAAWTPHWTSVQKVYASSMIHDLRQS